MTTATRRTRKAATTKAGSLNLLTGELKIGSETINPTAKKATAKKTTAKKATPAKKATAKKAAAVSDKPKKEQTFEERDWTYLDDKAPSEQHELLAKEINKRTNSTTECDCGEEVQISAKQVQAVLAMFPHFQRSETNKKRSGYRPLAEEIVHQRSVHMTQAHKDARLVMDSLAKATGTAKKTAKTAPTAKKAPATKPATKKATATATKKVPASQAHAAKKAVAKKRAAEQAASETF